ncbi:MAG: hypothetical protein ABI603_11085, partial [Acidobacteriota bacterium]
MYRPAVYVRAVLATLLLAAVPRLSAAGQTPAAAKPPSDLDAFMERVLARRDVNRATLKQYVLDETEA